MLWAWVACSGGGLIGEDTGEVVPGVWFEQGQAATVLLGGFGFDDSGGERVFNRPRGVASDGERLAVADAGNNRVLLWSSLPLDGEAPDGVVGQADFTANDTRELAWPVAVAVGGGKLVVADTDHDQLQIWNSWPTVAGQAPDLVLEGLAVGEPLPDDPVADAFVWPWGVWTDGTRLVVVSTKFEAVQGNEGGGGWVLIWNEFPTESGQAADVVLSADGAMGTPRGISTDGTWLAVGDHNASGQDSDAGTWVWEAWPTASETPPDAFVVEPDGGFRWLAGAGGPDGRALLAGGGLFGWDGAPVTAEPDLTLDAWSWGFRGGDGVGASAAGDGVFVSDPDANRVVGFSTWPEAAGDEPSQVLGALGLGSDAVVGNGLITNPVPVADGDALCVGDGYNLRLHCWQGLPTGQGTRPDASVQTGGGIEALAMHGGTVVTAGPVRGLQVWHGVPWDEREADEVWGHTIGTTELGSVTGLAMDTRYLYVVDREGWLHGFAGVADGAPRKAFSVVIDSGGALLHSDGDTLAVSTSRQVVLYAVDELEGSASGTVLPTGDWSGSLGQAIVADDRVFLVDQGAHRVYAWSSVDLATNGGEASLLLGAADWADRAPAQSASDLFWPRTLAFDGETLWVGEYKFGGRVLGFTGTR
jgi:hypothetical protein